MKLDEIRVGMVLKGLVPGKVATVIACSGSGDSRKIIYELPDQELGSRLIYKDSENLLSEINETVLRFSGDGAKFKLATEALRIHLAYLFDPMTAVNMSNVEPLPHQITAVYESMLPRQPLRFLLADDPGAGKTIMAGLLISELLLRSDACRILVVAPGNLVEQWQDELRDKFGLSFEIFSQALLTNSVSGNPFDEHDRLIARIDQLSRNDEYQAKLLQVEWDLVIFDEAHKLSATYVGQDIKKTKRFVLAEKLGEKTRHLLLMTATPHNGKEGDFQAFLSLLDPDRFYGKPLKDNQNIEVKDVMRRMVKEDMRRFDGSKLFPDRVAETVNYSLSKDEQVLYEEVTHYVREEMNRADSLLNKAHKNVVGFALTILQRRLASSPEAIYQSIRRRHRRLNNILEEIKRGNSNNGAHLPEAHMEYPALEIAMSEDWDIQEELPAAEEEEMEDELVQQASAAKTVKELEIEIEKLKYLSQLAEKVVASCYDRKWEEVSNLIHSEGISLERKLIIFTEHKDTLLYLERRLVNLYGRKDAVAVIHGGVSRELRRKIQDSFRNDPDLKVLIATDAAGEGVNLQNTNLMINYDLPWNPNRIEQRFGRIHRIGQTKTCYLWNMVAKGTREGDVFQRLFEKLKTQREALGGRVFDVLGEIFEEVSLKDLLIEAIRNENKDSHQVLNTLESVFDSEHVKNLVNDNALCREVFGNDRLFAVKQRMDLAEARKLQPHFIQSFFLEAFRSLGGTVSKRETGRYEIKHVPVKLQHFVVKNRKDGLGSRRTVLRKYERICFDKKYVFLPGRPNSPRAEIMHPGHPLLQAVNATIRQEYQDAVENGAVLIDKNNYETEPRLLVLVECSVREESGEKDYVSRQMQFLWVHKNGQISLAGIAPHRDLDPLTDRQREQLKQVIERGWDLSNSKEAVQQYANRLTHKMLEEAKIERQEHVERICKQVKQRLRYAIKLLDEKYSDLRERIENGKRRQGDEARLAQIDERIEILSNRLSHRIKELEQQKCLYSPQPMIRGFALVIPQGMLPGENTVDAASRRKIELLAMEAVTKAEVQLGRLVKDVSKDNKGWDIESMSKVGDGELLPCRYIEVKGRAKGADEVTVTKNEVDQALNLGEKFLLAIVFVDGDKASTPLYVKNPFMNPLDDGVTSVNFKIANLLNRSTTAEES